MTSVACNSFSAIEAHELIKKHKEPQKFGGVKCGDVTAVTNGSSPHHYSSKLMNSVWGLYNRYAPHAFQKNEEVFNSLIGSKLQLEVGW